MTGAMKPAREVAEAVERTARGASDAYNAARVDLLEAEIVLRRKMEAVSAQRRALPPGPEISDYVFQGLLADGTPGAVPLSELFRKGTDTLYAYCYMFPRHPQDDRPPATAGAIASLPEDQQPCPSCTGLIDQLDGAARHFEGLGGNIAVMADAPLDHLLLVAKERGWRHLRLVSSAGTGFKRDMNAIGDDGAQAPMSLVFHRAADGTIRLSWASDLVWTASDPGQDHRATGTIEPFWNLFDLTPGGRPEGSEQIEYDCCASPGEKA